MRGRGQGRGGKGAAWAAGDAGAGSGSEGGAPAEGIGGLPARALKKVKGLYGNGKEARAKLAAMGSSAMLAYGWISNLNACCLTMLSWVTFARSSGLSPLAPGQWKPFLAVYAGYYMTIGTVMRPLRIAIAAGLTPLFNRFIEQVMGRLKCSKYVAFGVTVFLANICCTISLFAVGIRLVTWFTGVPLFP